MGKNWRKMNVEEKYFFSFFVFFRRQDGARGTNVFWTFSQFFGAKKSGQKSGAKCTSKKKRIFVVFSAAWRGGFFGRFLSALESKKVGKKVVQNYYYNNGIGFPERRLV